MRSLFEMDKTNEQSGYCPVCPLIQYTGCTRISWQVLKFKNHLTRFAALQYCQSSCTMLFGV